MTNDKIDLDEILKDFADNFGSLEKGEWWGHDTNLGNLQPAFDEAKKQILELIVEARLAEQKEWVLPWTETAIAWEQDGEGSGIIYFDNERLGRLRQLQDSPHKAEDKPDTYYHETHSTTVIQ